MEITPAMSAAPLFRQISAEDLGELLTCMGALRRRYRRGELILQRGDRVERLGLVLSGAVHVVKEDFWGNRTIVGLAEPGEVFAESYACLSTEPLEVSALAAAGYGGIIPGCRSGGGVVVGGAARPMRNCPGTCWPCWRGGIWL